MFPRITPKKPKPDAKQKNPTNKQTPAQTKTNQPTKNPPKTKPNQFSNLKKIPIPPNYINQSLKKFNFKNFVL